MHTKLMWMCSKATPLSKCFAMVNLTITKAGVRQQTLSATWHSRWADEDVQSIESWLGWPPE